MGPWERMILHVDIDAFFVQAERLASPLLRDRPLLVGGGAPGRGTVACASYEARRMGARAGMPIERARLLCPGAVVVGCHPARVRDLAARFRAILLARTPRVETASIDEAFLDATDLAGTLREGIRLGRSIQAEIARRLSLTASLGIAPNKRLAKAASSLHKPGGWGVLDRERFLRRFAAEPVERLHGVGPSTASRLRVAGIARIGDLAAAPRPRLRSLLGLRGEILGRAAAGIDTDPVVPDGTAPPARSLGHEVTIPRDLRAVASLRRVLLGLSDEVARDLRAEGIRAGAVHLKVRTGDLRTRSRRLGLAGPTADPGRVFAAAWRAFESLSLRLPARSVGVSVSRLEAAPPEGAADLFGEDRNERFEEVASRLRAERATRALRRAALLPEGPR